jgi:hypothetical protein
LIKGDSMKVRRVLAAGVIGGLALLTMPSQASAATAPHQFRIVKLGANPGTIIAQGPYYGVGTETNTRHLVPLGSPFTVVFSFDHGDLYLNANPTPPQIDSDPTSCVTRITLQVNNVVTGGTGVYTGASGTGAGVSHITQVRGRASDGTCLPLSSPPSFELANVRVVETITLP